ncbi:DUF4871 domain-containing protein [Paenibacillus allorhizosphaerae]|uniref:DUF4871 domain-containing protein n=1 Tax=Paenibacillus allorhizosphaerae TaxID=2849866 RepID=A0ABN7TIU3_9BACL|nr:DUF4871 domain-containing protein [Paenibacillus allorhizosphaerae]CAG7634121.1 hypothetical protein PAECIP111802_02016 [Paenibacillus allorhizosphaerae]
MHEDSRPAWYKALKEPPRLRGGFEVRLAERVKERAANNRLKGRGRKLTVKLGLLLVAAAVFAVGFWSKEEMGTQFRQWVQDAEWKGHNAVWSEGKKLIEVFPGGDYAAGSPYGCGWNLYLPFESVKNSAIRIEAHHKETGLTVTELPETLLADKAAAYDDFTRFSSPFHLPVGGHWRFDVYLDNRKIGDVVFDVPDVSWEASPLFRSGSYSMRGEQGKLGFIDPGFMKGRPNKYMWHFWGKKEELQGALRIIGLHKGSHQWIDVFQADGIAVSALNGADGSIPTSMTLPEKGYWRLAVFLGERYFGGVTVEVK